MPRKLPPPEAAAAGRQGGWTAVARRELAQANLHGEGRVRAHAEPAARPQKRRRAFMEAASRLEGLAGQPHVSRGWYTFKFFKRAGRGERAFFMKENAAEGERFMRALHPDGVEFLIPSLRWWSGNAAKTRARSAHDRHRSTPPRTASLGCAQRRVLLLRARRLPASPPFATPTPS